MKTFSTFFILFISFSFQSIAQDSVRVEFKETPSVTHHQIEIDDKSIHYTARAGYLPIVDEKNKTKAYFFYVAYTKDNVNDKSKRPVTFSFNGGPGSSSVWLHMGALGPKRIGLDKQGNAPPPPYQLLTNEQCWLDVTDLVFIDPVSTGYSRPAKGEKKDQFHGYKKDVKSVGQFIHQYIKQNKRWNSPKFLIGESYGTTRATGLAHHLTDEYHMYLNGVILVSAVLDFQTLDYRNELSNLLFFPTYTATAWYHKQLSGELQQNLNTALKKAEKFSIEKYSVALLQGNLISQQQKTEIIREYSQLTNLAEDYIEKNHLRINPYRFRKALLKDSALIVGRFDSRYLLPDIDVTGPRILFDPSYVKIDGIFGATFNHYLQSELKYNNNLKYELLSDRVHPWELSKNRYLDLSHTLSNTLIRNPDMKIWIANGYYDLATPYFATEYTVNHLNIPANLQKNIIMTYYQAGHMMYLKKNCLEKMKQDAVNFYNQTLNHSN